MEMTMKNLGLTLSKVELELQKNNVQAAKTLMNTYRNLLGKFARLPYGETKEIDIHEKELKEQKGKLEQLSLFVENATSYRLMTSDYKDADNLVMVSDRVESSIRIINDLFKFRDKAVEARLKKEQSSKEKQKLHILLNDSAERGNAEYLLDMLLGKEITRKRNIRNELVYDTNDFKIIVEVDGSHNLLGKRADFKLKFKK